MSLSWETTRWISPDKSFYEGTCLSTDEKPTGGYILNGSSLKELDTCKIYFYDEENEEWREWT